MVQSKRIQDITEFIKEFGIEEAQKQFGLHSETLYRYIRATKQSKKSNIKILLLDIETTPIKAWVWSRWKQNIYLDQTISEWFMLSWSAKWLFDTEIMSEVLTKKEVLREDDKRICSSIWKLIDEADIVIAHNGMAFDEKKLNARFLVNGLPPVSPYQVVDTKLVAAKQFGFSSNKLDALASYFGIPVKLDTDFELWARCMAGDVKSLKYMEEYNRHDVAILEEVYVKMRPWIRSHPNLGLYIDDNEPVCSVCGSPHIHLKGHYTTSVGVYPTYVCDDCGAFSRSRKSIVTKEKRDSLLVSVAR